MEVFVALSGFRLKKQTQIKPIIYTGSDAEWIPVFAGMTDNKYPYKSVSNRKRFEKTNPIFKGHSELKFLYERVL